MASSYTFPEFWQYPPYFTIQPIAETFEKQKRLWLRLIVDWCKSTKTFTLDVHNDKVEVFSNKRIDRCLDVWEKRLFLDALCEQGSGRWLDGGKNVCLILWKPLDAWAEDIYTWCTKSGDTIILLDDLLDVREDSEIFGLPMDHIIVPAVEILEKKHLVKTFTPRSHGTSLGLKIL